MPMHPPRWMRWAALLPAALLGAACGPRTPPPTPLPPPVTVSNGPVGSSFSLLEQGGEIHVLFAELETLSLKTDILRLGQADRPPEIAETLFLDRIQHTQEPDAFFGNHFYGLYGREQQVFYLDQQKEDRQILKWIHRERPEGAWIIDALPIQGRIIAGLRDPQGRTVLYLQAEDALVAGVSPRFARFDTILHPFLLEGDVSPLDGTSEAGFTAYDRGSGRLVLVRQGEAGYTARSLLRIGRVHHAFHTAEGGLGVLVYDFQKAELSVHFERDGTFRPVPVTPCRGTHSVYAFESPAGACYLYNEVLGAEDGRKSHQISLLYPLRSGYGKVCLYRSREPILKFRALRAGPRLLVAFSQEALRLIVADLERLGISSGS